MISICFILFLLISILTSSYGQVTCPSGWSQYGGNCYLISPVFNSGSTQGTWDQCNAWCPTSYPGATMLCVNNAAENEWIWTQYPGRHFWIGYTDMLPYGGGKGTKQYGWVTGCISTYTNWAAGLPDNRNNNEDYAFVNWYGDSKWDDISPVGWVYCGCEYTPALTTTPSSRPSTVPSSRPSVAPSSGPTSSPTATPSFSSSQGDVSE
jgi:hypothetical protein